MYANFSIVNMHVYPSWSGSGVWKKPEVKKRTLISSEFSEASSFVETCSLVNWKFKIWLCGRNFPKTLSTKDNTNSEFEDAVFSIQESLKPDMSQI